MSDNILVLLLIVSCGMAIMIVGFFLLFHRSQSRIAAQQRRLQEEKLAHHRQLITAAITSQDAERKRIGQDLHDEIGTALAILRLMLDQYATMSPDDVQFVHACKAKIDQIIKSCRHISHNLSPEMLTINTLTASIEELCDGFGSAMKITLTGDDQVWPLIDSLPADRALHIYRILEEALHNTLKHAGATAVLINFYITDEWLHVDYRDDGQGIHPEKGRPGHGMQHMESRLLALNAAYDPVFKPMKGYNLHFAIPLETPDMENSAGRSNLMKITR